MLYSLKIIRGLNNAQGVSAYLGFLKNTLLNHASGVLSGQYETWVELYHLKLNLYANNLELRENELLELDQILSEPINTPSIQ